MCYPVDGDCWVTYSLVKDMNEALEDYKDLEVLTELLAYLGDVKHVVSQRSFVSRDGGADRPRQTRGSEIAR